MNLIKTLFQRQRSQPLRAVVATKSENLAAQRRRNDKRLELEVMKVTLFGDDEAAWKAAVQRGATVKFETPEQRFKRHERKAFAGMAVSPLKVGKA